MAVHGCGAEWLACRGGRTFSGCCSGPRLACRGGFPRRVYIIFAQHFDHPSLALLFLASLRVPLTSSPRCVGWEPGRKRLWLRVYGRGGTNRTKKHCGLYCVVWIIICAVLQLLLLSLLQLLLPLLLHRLRLPCRRPTCSHMQWPGRGVGRGEGGNGTLHVRWSVYGVCLLHARVPSVGHWDAVLSRRSEKSEEFRV